MLRFVYGFFFNFFGWKIKGHIPAHLRKYIIAVAPHTSNWDFPVGLMARSVLHLKDVKFLGKSQLFRAPFGFLFRALGGYPVDRKSSHDMVSQVVKLFNTHNDFILAIAPEGTRKKVDKLRSGFYYIAKNANIPIVPCGFDYEKKEVVIGDPFYPSDNMQNDFDFLYSFYRKIKGKNPELGVSISKNPD